MSMAGYGVASPPSMQPANFPAPQPQYAQQIQQQVRPGTLPPGTCIKIGDYEVTIERFLSEGGFAHVYLVRSTHPIPSPAGSSETYHVLKRVAAADKPVLREIRWEVDVMKLLRGHKYIVNLIEASASMIPGTSGYEVFILMEYCSGGGIIDFMNTRLQNRLTEQEILKIFSDVVEGVCWMHTRDPPLMHRDLKVENILLSGPGQYKLCDFGSTAVPKPKPAQTMQEIQELEADLNKHTTIQYRAPEMCDVWSRKGVGLPSDIWALGVLLYKLCFYTTPFEQQGPLAILNVQYEMPSYPNYSQDIRALIASMLVESVTQRPSAWQLHKEVCRLRGVPPNPSYQTSPGQKLLSAGQSPGSLHGSVSPALPNLPVSRPTSGLGSVLESQNGGQPFSSTLKSIDAGGISPMRRGRPGKGPQGEPSKLQSEWSVSAPIATEPGQGQQEGFADTFSPPQTSQSVPLPTEPYEAIPDPVKPSKTALATAALFEELSSPGSTVKAPPTLASLAAARNGQAAPQARQVGMGLPAGMQQQQNGLRRFSPGKPLGPRSLSNASQGSTSKAPAPAAKPGFLGLQLQQETTEISPRDSFTADSSAGLDEKLERQAERRPSFVSRGSQTSPKLLSDWMQDQQRSLAVSESSPAAASPQADGPDSMSKFPSLADWEGSVSPGLEADARSESLAAPRLQRTASRTSDTSDRQQQAPAIDLLGDDPDGIGSTPAHNLRDAVSPAPSNMATAGSPVPDRSIVASPPSFVRTPSQLSAASAQISPRSASGSFSSLERTPSMTHTRSNSLKPEPPKEKFKPVKRESSPPPALQRQVSASSARSQQISAVPEAREAESSDEDEGPEDVAGQRYGGRSGEATPSATDLPPQTKSIDPPSTSSSRQASGNFDIKPALASIEKFAPKANGKAGPPLLAPKPTKPGLSSLVSQYETLSAGSSPTSPGGGRAKGPPVKAPKPVSSVLSKRGSMDDFSARFPALDGSAPAQAAGNTPPQAKREPFKPSRDSSVSSLAAMAEGRARPQSMHFPTPPPAINGSKLVRSDSLARPAANEQKSDGEQEEKFQGVASLRDRWNKMGQQQQQQQSSSGSSLDRRASTMSRWK